MRFRVPPKTFRSHNESGNEFQTPEPMPGSLCPIQRIERIRDAMTMRYINLLFTYLLSYFTHTELRYRYKAYIIQAAIPGTRISMASLSEKSRAHSTQSSMDTFLTGMNGHTSSTPIRGCSPTEHTTYTYRVTHRDVRWGGEGERHGTSAQNRLFMS